MLKQNIKYFCLFFCLFFLRSGIGQEPGMWHLTDEDGLPSMTVYNIAQDSKGYIWMGTEKGICRFDGKAFEYYKSPDLSDNEILKILIDSLGRVWFINLSGQLFYIEENQVYRTENLLKDSWQSVSGIEITDSTLWASIKIDGKERIGYWTLKANKRFSKPFFFEEKFIRAVSLTQKGSTISALGDDRGDGDGFFDLVEVDRALGKLLLRERFDFKEYKDLSAAFYLNDQIFLRFNKAGNFLSLFEDDKVIPLLEVSNKIVTNVQVIDNYFWIMTRKGIYKKAVKSTGLLTEPYLLDDIPTNCLLVDRENNKWIGTTGQGIYVITAPQINVYQSDNTGLARDEVYSLKYDESKNQLLVGHDKGMISILDNYTVKRKISFGTSGRTLEILASNNEQYLFANDNGLFTIKGEQPIVNHKPSSIKSLFESKDENIWFGTYCCLLKTKNGDDFNPMEYSSSMLREKTYALHQDFANATWAGTINGLYRFEDNKSIPFLEEGKHISYNVSTITQTKDSMLWIGTRGDGLIGIKKNKVLVRLKEEDGLASNTIKKIQATDDHLWIGTDNGLNKFNLTTKEWKWINVNDGLPSNEIYAIEIAKQDIWIGTAKGLVNFPINTDHTNYNPLPIYISNIKIEDEDVLVLDSFFLPYDQNSIQIDYLGLGFKGKGNISYEYQMSGVDEDWVSTKARFTRYPNLEPGDYTFKVITVNEDKIKSKKPAVIYVSISPPWWRTWWFRILSALVIIGSIGYFINIQIQKQKRERAFSKQVNELKTMALRSQMNPHFVFNALNAIQKFLATNNREQAMNYLSKFGKLIRTIFEQLQKEKISLEEELEFLNLYLNLEALRFMDRVDIQMKVSPDLQDINDEINIPPLLIQPIIENSFKHGFLYKKEQGILKINFYREGTFLVCTIEDNGIGRKKAAELGQQNLKDRSSSGLLTAQERLAINNERHKIPLNKPGIKITDIEDVKGEVSGTLVEVNIYCSELMHTR